MRLLHLLLTALLLVLAVPFASVNAQGTPSSKVVATGLNNPRGLTFGHDGALYVAEAGSGGSGPCAPGPEGELCFGLSGSVTRVDFWRGLQERIVTGLPSVAAPDGSAAGGPHDVAIAGFDTAVVTIGLGADPTNRTRDFGPAGARLAQLLRGVPTKGLRPIADLGDYESKANPDGAELDTNPYGVLTLGSRILYIDAGGNSLVQRNSFGNLTTLAVFAERMAAAPPFLGLPPGAQIPMDSVPTSVARGPHGHLYVGELTGFPFPVGGARIYRLPTSGGTPDVHATGFTAVVDLAFGHDGALYVLEVARNGLLAAFNAGDWAGAVIRLAPDGSRTDLTPDGLVAPGGIAVGPDGALYVTNHSISPGIGEVIRIQP